MKKTAFLLPLLVVTALAETHPLQDLIRAARENPAKLKELLPANIHDLKERGGSAAWGQDFLFAIDTDKTPSISVDRQPPVPMARVPDSNFWYKLMKLRIGVTHSYEFHADGRLMGRLYVYDVAGYNPDSYPRPGVPRGVMSEKMTIQSRAYPGSSTDFWVYASPGVDRSNPAALMVWQDGRGFVGVQDLVRMRLAGVYCEGPKQNSKVLFFQALAIIYAVLPTPNGVIHDWLIYSQVMLLAGWRLHVPALFQ